MSPLTPGPGRGTTTSIEVTVTEEMTATVGDREIHPVYGTAALIGHMEEVCRSLLEPYLDPNEEGVGYRIEATHRAPAAVGTKLTITATVAAARARSLVCEVLVKDGHGVVARGSFEQRVVDVEWFTSQVEERRG